VCWSVLECVGVCWSVLECVVVCWSVLECPGVCWSVLQCVAVIHVVDIDIHEVDKPTVLQCVAVCVAVCCSDSCGRQRHLCVYIVAVSCSVLQ